MSGERSKTFELKKSIEYKDTTYTELTVSAPTIGQLRQSYAKLRSGRNEETQIQFGVALVARCAGLPEEVIDKLDADEFMEALSFASSFLPEEEKAEKAGSTEA
ncbi:MAG TPA: phage tail assembly protein [Acidisoma sp.]|nr:phage tail assembly protein [Acidisoma sp.]